MKFLCVSTKPTKTADDIKNCFLVCEIPHGMTKEEKDEKLQKWLDAGGKAHFDFPCQIFTAEIEVGGGIDEARKVFKNIA